MEFARALEEVLKYRRIPPTLEILYEEREGSTLRSILILGNGKVRYQKLTGKEKTESHALTTFAEIEKILSHLFVHEFWRIKSVRGKGKQVTLSIGINQHRKVISLPYSEISAELTNQVDKGKMLERPAGRFLVATLWIEGLINKMEKRQKQIES